ncbi:hypothetical protein Mapa_014440 [Marchantia paleacea]|nr:hypothetical protein Mapa_014440 [Marchantia paleacea]
MCFMHHVGIPARLRVERADENMRVAFVEVLDTHIGSPLEPFHDIDLRRQRRIVIDQLLLPLRSKLILELEQNHVLDRLCHRIPIPATSNCDLRFSQFHQ